MAGNAPTAPDKAATPADTAPKGDAAQEEAVPGDPAGLTLADLPHLAVAAPGASPDGATHYLTDEGKTAEAWLAPGDDGVEAGFIRSSTAPDRAVRVDDVRSWAQIVDSMGLAEADLNAEPEGDDDAEASAAAADQDAEPAAATGEEAPAAKAPATGQKGLSGETEEVEGKAAAAGNVVTPEDHEERTGIMVALIVPEGDAADIMLTDFPTALPAAELHLTLAYLGKTDEVTDEGAFYANVLDALRDVASEHEALTGVVSGIGRFSIPGDADAFYYSFDAPELPDLRHDVVEALEEAGLKVSRDHGFTPHITIAYLKEGEENPIRRAESKVLAFENLTFCFGDQRLNIRLGGTNPDEADAEFHPEAGRPGHLDSTAPSAMPDGKGANPFAKGGKRGGPPIAAGAFVSWGNQRGKVDLVVTNGKVPGVEEDITGSKDKPAARVVVYEQGAGGKWKSTGKKVGVSASSLKRSAPFTFGKKDLDLTDPEGALVDLLTEYYEVRGEQPAVDPLAVKAVYERGIVTWPGEHTGVPNEAWALGRTKAFLAVAAGVEIPGYAADRDLLPEGHPLAVKAAPVLVVRTNDTGEPERILTPEQTREIEGQQEQKVALTVMQGESFVDAEAVRKMIAEMRGLGLGHA